MPDQYTAATEHALIAKIAEPLDELPDDPLAAVSVDFPVALRGYDRFAVDAYVERTAQLVAELQSTRSPQGAVRRALERVGGEISGILQRAHDTADEITARSRAEAEERLETARREATEIAAEAERRVRELDAETERIWAERHSIVTDAQELARRLTELAETALGRFPADGSSPALNSGPPEGVRPAPIPAHLFDGALEPERASGAAGAVEGAWEADGALEAEQWAEPFAGEQPTVAEPMTDDQPVAEPMPEQPMVDQPTVGMPPLEPWEPGEDTADPSTA
jgi:cell division septum initiation protein DivIVA